MTQMLFLGSELTLPSVAYRLVDDERERPFLFFHMLGEEEEEAGKVIDEVRKTAANQTRTSEYHYTQCTRSMSGCIWLEYYGMAETDGDGVRHTKMHRHHGPKLKLLFPTYRYRKYTDTIHPGFKSHARSLKAFIEREDLIITHPPWYKSLIVPPAFARPIPDGAPGKR
ncbi:hypothetical protein DAPPUDRAFT_232150 [Daphnia pulex]|uniref:Uncharacterized protein n=1 Tax=Daphnia pulex TaxID=6669 RepID=E9FRZ8_DAPPU|nr:hypothetical protein DAPPUDRAFT_232150 [Daphnia pulex]|eukprot:EFX89940.1 hypothetical protein DAPPUDRAFT_232150 [Daphnia pulex]